MSDLILFDRGCPFCQRWILFLLKRDYKKKFQFSSLNGETAQSMSGFLQTSDQETLILIEDYGTKSQSVCYRSKAIYKILWKLGGIYKLSGWKYILPSFLFDWAYNLLARNRKHLCSKCISQKLDAYQERFLP